MRIFVTGTNGFVGSHIVAHLLRKGHTVFASSRTKDLSFFGEKANYEFVQADFTDSAALNNVFERVRPQVVIHTGAMSKPDDCERNKEAAEKVNVKGTRLLLEQAGKYQSHFIHLSTDFIFNGEKGMHKENDLPDPLSYYGKTKRDAEQLVKDYRFKWTIVRTVFVYGKPLYGRDCFLNMIAKKLRNNEPFRIVNDQERTPTYVGDLADGIAAIAGRSATGIFHLSGKDVLTPYEMAMQVAAFHNITEHKLTPVRSAELNELAKRPLKSGLDISKAAEQLAYAPVSFSEGLKETFA